MYFIVIPTYNEKDNIVVLIKKIEKLYGSEKDLSILVADDNSPDGTRNVVEDYISSKKNKLPIIIITKKDKTGLRDAYFNAFKYLIKTYPKILGIIQMDADLSHDPKYIKKHLSNLRDGIDLSMGSRYIKGGSIENWGMDRILLSRLGNSLNRLILSSRIHDYTGGYNGLSLRALQFVLIPGKVSSSGYYFLTEMKYRLIMSDEFAINEFPIIFTDRVSGDSKMGNGIIVESIKQLIYIRLNKNTKTVSTEK